MADFSFKKIATENLPVGEDGNLKADLYIFIPTPKKYVRYVCSGEPLSQEKAESVARHADPSFYIYTSDNSEASIAVTPTPAAVVETAVADAVITEAVTSAPSIPAVAPLEEKEIENPEIEKELLPVELRVESIGKPLRNELKQIFLDLINTKADPTEMVKNIEKHADNIVNAIAPETKQIKEELMKHAQYALLMNDAAAITSIAVFLALAAGFDSKKSYKDLSYACLIMDAGMSEFDEATIEQYYKDRTQLPFEVLSKIQKHPVKSHQLATEKIKSVSEVTMQLILSHHELFNGKGYPRQIRYESLFPMVKVLSMAVDIYETLKGSELNGNPMTLNQAVLKYKEPNVEPHLRRHSKKLVDSVIAFYKLEGTGTETNV